MSAINKIPFIKHLLTDMTAQELKTLNSLINGQGDRTSLLRTMNIKPVGTRSHITEADKGVHLCSLEINYSLFDGYLIYTEHYCTLISFTDAQVLTMFNIELEDLTKFATVDEALSVLELRSSLNDMLIEKGEGMSVGSEDIDSANEPAGKALMSDGEGGAVWGEVSTATYAPFDSSWTTNGTTKAFCDAVAATESAVKGMAYVGEVYFTDMPVSGNAEVIVEIMNGDTAASKIIKLTLTSGNVAPYHWEYTYWNNGVNVSGWKEFGGIVITLNSNSGTLTNEQFKQISGDNCIIKNGNYIFHKTFVSTGIYTNPHYVSFYPYLGSVWYTRYFSALENTKTYVFYDGPNIQTVLANPSDNNGADLEGIQIGNTKYKIPQGMQVLELVGSSGTLTWEQYLLVDGNNCIIYVENYGYFYKNAVTNVSIEYVQSSNFTGLDNASTYSFIVYSYDRHYSVSTVNLPKTSANPTLSGGETELTALKIGNANYSVGDSVNYTTTAPVADNTSGRLMFAILSSEPATRYAGYLYIITGSQAPSGGGTQLYLHEFRLNYGSNPSNGYDFRLVSSVSTPCADIYDVATVFCFGMLLTTPQNIIVNSMFYSGYFLNQPTQNQFDLYQWQFDTSSLTYKGVLIATDIGQYNSTISDTVTPL